MQVTFAIIQHNHIVLRVVFRLISEFENFQIRFGF
jgi:hypothetical protein